MVGVQARTLEFANMKWRKTVRGGLFLLLPWAHCVCGDVMMTTLFSFPSNVNDIRFASYGASPSSLLIGIDGSIFGTTSAGGANGCGTIFSITPTGNLRTLVNIPADSGWCGPLIQSSDGNFLGTTLFGGTMGLGSLFLAAKNGGFATLISFDGKNGSYPFGRLVQGPDGFLYGTANNGGLSKEGIELHVGTVFKSGSPLFTFGGTNGVGPSDGLIMGRDGNLYGVTQSGGKSNAGTVFRISTTGKLVTIHTFSGRFDGATPVGGLIQAADGYLYGTTSAGGSGNGTVFRMDVSGNMMSSISLNGVNGAYPVRRLMQCKDGSIYGTTSNGGFGYTDGNPRSGYGTVFRLSGNNLTTSVFFHGDDGQVPMDELVQDFSGDLYGTTSSGGIYGGGTIYKLSTTPVPQAKADFSMSASSGEAPLAILFANTSSGTITGIDWDFGDGSHSSFLSPLHTYNKAGNYTVLLKVAGGGGASNKSAQIQVTNPPPPPTLKTFAAKNATITFAWNTIANRSYQVQYREDLSKTIWMNLGGIINATNSTAAFSDALGTARASQRFYRVVLLP